MVGVRLLLFVGLALAILTADPAAAGERRLSIEIGGSRQSFTARQLLDSPEAQAIEVPHDATYRRPMHYRAVPLDRLLSGKDLPREQSLEAVAADGFVGLLPVDLILHPSPGGARAYLAIEPAAAPWPPLPGQTASAGPFYIVWINPEAAGVRSEQWPYQVVTIRSADSPARRWPALGVDPSLPADDPVRQDQTLFVTQCLVCHRLNGAGSADVGPDLNRPENPTAYFQEGALKRYIRDPASVRRWPKMQMKAFDKEALSDREIDLIIAYLRHMAGRPAAP